MQPGVTPMPEFSIVIAVFNREALIARALASCLAQERADFEVIVVDDGSTDKSVAIVRSFRDSRLRLLCHEMNRGAGAAGNTGIAAAAGEWIVQLDSDDELLPGALSRMSEIARAHAASVERMAFMFRRDDGRVSPLPPLRDEILDYESYLNWLEHRIYFDFLSCTRRSTYAAVRREEAYWCSSTLYHLNFALRFRTLCRAETLGLVHTDADNRSSWKRRMRTHAIEAAPELGQELDSLLSRHGDALRRFAPLTSQKFERLRASYHFLAGARGPAVRRCLRCLAATPLSYEAWGLLLCGLAGAPVYSWLRSLRPPPT